MFSLVWWTGLLSKEAPSQNWSHDVPDSCSGFHDNSLISLVANNFQDGWAEFKIPLNNCVTRWPRYWAECTLTPDWGEDSSVLQPLYCILQFEVKKCLDWAWQFLLCAAISAPTLTLSITHLCSHHTALPALTTEHLSLPLSLLTSLSWQITGRLLCSTTALTVLEARCTFILTHVVTRTGLDCLPGFLLPGAAQHSLSQQPARPGHWTALTIITTPRTLLPLAPGDGGAGVVGGVGGGGGGGDLCWWVATSGAWQTLDWLLLSCRRPGSGPAASLLPPSLPPSLPTSLPASQQVQKVRSSECAGGLED